MPIARLTADAGPDEVAAAVGRDGAVIVEGVPTPALLERIESELRPFLDATPTGPDDFSGQLTRRTGRSSPARRRAGTSSCTRWRWARRGRSSGTPPTSSSI